MEDVLWLISFLLMCLLIGKDMSGKEELEEIRDQIKRIADHMEERRK